MGSWIDRNRIGIGRWAWIMAWVGLVVGQVHALARFQTADGREDLEYAGTRWWAEPAADALHPLLGWADADVVYVTWGKIWFPVFAAFTLMAFVTFRDRRPSGFEKLVWRVVLAVFVVATVGVFLDYWTQWTGAYNGTGIEHRLFAAGVVLTFPSFALMLLLVSVLGVTLLMRGFRPLVPALLLALFGPLAVAITSVTSLGSAALPAMFAFGILGRRLAGVGPRAGSRAADVGHVVG